MFNLLAPTSPDFYITVESHPSKLGVDEKTEARAWAELIFWDSEKKEPYYRYRIYVQEEMTLDLLLGILRQGLRLEGVPPIFYEAPYIYKIRQALGWTPTAFDFLAGLRTKPEPPKTVA